MSIANVMLSMGIDMVALVWRICATSMERHWQKKSEEQYEREFREESWEPYEVYLQQRWQRERWSRFSLRDHHHFWHILRRFASSILEMERQIEEEIQMINQKHLCFQMINNLETTSNVQLLRQTLTKQTAEARERLHRLREESKKVQADMTRVMFTAPYRYLYIVNKLFLCRIIQHRFLGGPTQRIFAVEYPANNIM